MAGAGGACVAEPARADGRGAQRGGGCGIASAGTALAEPRGGVKESSGVGDSVVACAVPGSGAEGSLARGAAHGERQGALVQAERQTMASRAIAIVADPALARLAAQRLLQGMRAESTVRAEGSKISLLDELVRVSGGGQLLPLRPAALEAPLGAMKEVGYKSASSYLGAARRLHIRMGHELTPQLAAWLSCAGGECCYGSHPFSA